MLRFFAVPLLLVVATLANAEHTHIAVAANFAAPMQAIIQRFEEQSEHQVTMAVGSSGKFYAQIRQGAPFDLFYSADQDKPQRLEQAGLVKQNTRYTYATGSLVLWSRRANSAELALEQLESGDFNKLALANPKLAPYGQAAVEILTKLGLDTVFNERWVQGENIAQTYNFVHSGNADMGFVALSQIKDIKHQPVGATWPVPANLYAPIHQDAVWLQRASDNPAAQAFYVFMRSAEATQLIVHAGYRLDSL